jgi:hypothetical protein
MSETGNMKPNGVVVTADDRAIGRVTINASGKSYRGSRKYVEVGVDIRRISQGFRTPEAAVAWINRQNEV